MTRKEMITKCVEDQIERGIIKAENKNYHIKVRLKGGNGLRAMSKMDCEDWYNQVFGGEQ